MIFYLQEQGVVLKKEQLQSKHGELKKKINLCEKLSKMSGFGYDCGNGMWTASSSAWKKLVESNENFWRFSKKSFPLL